MAGVNEYTSTICHPKQSGLESRTVNAKIFFTALVWAALTCRPSFAFEGRLAANLTYGAATPLLYTVGTNSLRVEMTDTNRPYPVDIVDRSSGELTLVYPRNHSFVRLKPAADDSPPGIPPMPATPNQPPPGIGPQAAPGQPAMPAMPMMPPPIMEPLVLQDMGQKTNLLGFVCEHYEIKQGMERMEIWATDQLCPFQPYVQNEPHRSAPRRMEEQWAGLLAGKNLFPLLAVLRLNNGMERYRFEVQSVRPQKLTDEDTRLFQPPADYFEIQPRPF